LVGSRRSFPGGRLVRTTCGLALAAVVVLSPWGSTARALEIPPIVYKQRILANGLKVLTSVDRSTPNASVQVWYGVGSKNDPEGRSGFAHLFEHLMFKATRDMQPETIDRLTEDVGGTNNAFTAEDTTAYYESVPANHLERLIWAEAERMGSLVVDEANFTSERDVVKEELRQRVLANPYGPLSELMIPEESYQVHPYRRPPIGSIPDLDAASLDDVRAFHARFYRPDDAALIVVGNFDQAALDGWIDKYFGALTTPAAALPKVTVTEPPRTGPRTITRYGPNVPLPAVAITWLAPGASDPDAPALEVLEAILATGKASRLYQSLVYRQQLAQEADANADLHAQLGLFYVTATLAGGKTAEAGEAALRAQVAALREAPVSVKELEVAKVQSLAQALRRRETDEGRAFELGQAVTIEGDAERANTDLSALQAVTAGDVQRVAGKYLKDDTRLVIRYLPGPAQPAGDSGAAQATPPQTRFIGEAAELAPAGQREAPPPPGPPVAAVLPSPVARKLSNGLRVIVARSTDLPLLTAELLVSAGAGADPPRLAGTAGLTANLMTEGTTTRTAPQIARETEALGATLEGSSGWDSSGLTLSVLRDRAGPALAIMDDVAEHPSFAPAEFERVRRESIDALSVAYREPGRLAALATAPVVYAGTPFGHVADGTPQSLERLSRNDIAGFHAANWRPDQATLVLTGNVTPEDGFALAQAAFGGWQSSAAPPSEASRTAARDGPPRAVVINLPDAGQAAVVLTMGAIPRSDPRYYPGLVANAVLGGGYSARLNEEIRVKRGLSYGASSTFSARRTIGALTAEVETRNETVPQVVTLLRDEVSRLATIPAGPAELEARKSALIGEYGRDLATTDGLADILGNLAVLGVGIDEIKLYTTRVEAVSAGEVQSFARDVLGPARASLIVVGDVGAFGPSLKAAIPAMEVIPVSRLDLDRPGLRGP
jgi:zinc protease